MDVLLTAIGKNPRETTYCLNGREAEAEFAPLALAKLLCKSFAKVYVLVTHGVKLDEWPCFQKQMQMLTPSAQVTPIEIPDGKTTAELSKILQGIAQNIGTDNQGFDLTLDITHGLRHFPFLFHALVLYLSALRGVKVTGVYYGALEMPGEEKPFVDLKPIVGLPEWSYAVRVFRETGATGPIADLIGNFRDNFRQKAKTSGNDITLHQIAAQFGKIAEKLSEFSRAYESALPVELGNAAKSLYNQLQSPPNSIVESIPLSEELLDQISKMLIQFKLSAEITAKGPWKAKVSLNESELRRQILLIDLYLKRNQVALALGLMREWLVSLVMFHSGQHSDWLIRKQREGAEHRLGGLGEYIRRRSKLGLPEPSKEQELWGQFWNLLSEGRNYYHHHGMNHAQNWVDIEKIKSLWDDWKTNLPEPPQLGGGKGRLLVCPFGLSPGVLFSALQHIQPNQCLLLSSQVSISQTTEAITRAGWPGKPDIAIVQDPFKGFLEYEAIRKAKAEMLFLADEVLINLTGGTTLLGIFAQQLSEQAKKFQRPVRRFVLIDSRSPENQKNDPYQLAEIHWLDKNNNEAEE